MKHGLLSICLLGAFALNAQTAPQRKEITANYNLQKLATIKLEAQQSERAKQAKVIKASQKNGWPIEVYKNGQLIKKAMDVNDKGQPIYTALYNADASASTRTNYLNSGGGLGLNLDGENMVIGIWDGGTVMETHIEFADGPFGTSSRVIIKDAVSDEFHATHVGGTMIARGSDPDAKGMAPKAELISYDWTDDRSEVATEAANGLLISNHSYGVYVFNPNGTMQVDPAIPGKYIGAARAWDVIHYNAPKYLMVMAAGNEGQLSYPQSLAPNKDKLTYEANSKNNLVVANAQDAIIDSQGNLVSVLINDSSSQGPTDDRRIKPDITGNGTVVYSTSNFNNTSYANATGTSMASPNVAGSLLLLQEYYHNLHGTFMRSATLKGLALHTADDAGVLGPDAVFGWGLLNEKKAAETIAGDVATVPDDNIAVIQELTLTQGQTYSIQVEAPGTEDLKASITWTDYPGSVADDQLNSSTPVLVNDLDIRVTQNSTTFLPWKLNFFDIAGPAIKGDNTVDNVERVDVENPSGLYTITVTHKGGLFTGSQDYSLIITGIEGGVQGVDEFNQTSISVWPNPANNTINISQAPGIDYKQITMYDLNGRIVKTFDDIDSTKTFTVNISDMATGVYILKLTTDHNVSVRKRIIKK